MTMHTPSPGLQDGQIPDRPAALEFPSGIGQSDTHATTLSDGRPNPHASAGKPYGTIAATSIVALLREPQEVPKEQARWFIPSTYAAHDARNHAVQRERGEFWWLAVDTDENDLDLADIETVVGTVAPGATRLVYATRSSKVGDKRWRVLIPLAAPISGVDYTDTATAFYTLLEDASGGTFIPDPKLALTGQLVYLPNRGEHFEAVATRGHRLALAADHPIVRQRDAERQRIANEKAFAEKLRQTRRAAAKPEWETAGASPIEHFNAGHSVAEMLERYGYRQLGSSSDWRSPMQSSRTFATKDFGDYWVSLSGSDASAGVGSETATGARHGDAFDLFVHFEHRGNFSDAVRSYAKKAGLQGARGAEKPSVMMNNPQQFPAQGANALKSSAGAPTTFRHEELDLTRDDKERPHWNMANAVEILTNHPDWQDVLAYDEFAVRHMLMRPIPGSDPAGFKVRELADHDATVALCWFNRNGFPRATSNIVGDALDSVARRNVISPVRHYLEGLRWDGKARIGAWLQDYAGADDSLFAREAGKRWLISAVARALKPGCKVDSILILEGTQGLGKSTALRALAGDDWFHDALPDMKNKDASSYLRGKWIIEIAELNAVRRSEMETVKAFLSRQEEMYRAPYGRKELLEPRRCVFAGSTNRDDYLRDETGNRRFWPVRVHEMKIEDLKRDRDQIWAEAVAAYRNGEIWWLQGEAEVQAKVEQDARHEDDSWLSAVAVYTTGRSEVACREVLGEALGFSVSQMDMKASHRVAGLLRKLGYHRAGVISRGEHKGQAKYLRE